MNTTAIATSRVHRAGLPDNFIFNMNSYIRVKLTTKGYIRLAELNNELADRVTSIERRMPSYYSERADAEGYTRFQMWSFMAKFGPLSSLHMPEYFATDIIISSVDLLPQQ